MIRGKVNRHQQAVIPIAIMGSDDGLQSLEFVLDTGFTGYLTLPPDSIRLLGLPSAGHRIFELANGEPFEFNTYLATVSWHGRLCDALVLQSDSVPLLGMDLLWDSSVRLQAWADGEVTIEERSSAPPPGQRHPTHRYSHPPFSIGCRLPLVL